MVKLFDGKYEIRTEPNNFVLVENTITKSGKKKQYFRYYATLEGLCYRIIQLETKNIFTKSTLQSLEEIAKKQEDLSEKLYKEIKKCTIMKL